MRRILLASHGKFADGIYNSLQMIMGEQERISTLCAFVDGNIDLKEEVNKIISALLPNDELIVITDIFGGSVNNLFMQYLSDSRIHLISGLNLPLLIELVGTFDDPVDTKSWLLKTLTSTKNSILYCNDLLLQHGMISEETF